ncbi:cupredoxin family copper-binding protein [Methanococcoides methylutens]|uniref:Copper binding protein, plastocyanin/azurin family n=1 Tax=Methanococcoides methylutens MM1 TaxID=1434104 RepID=A0A0E3SRZ6_METMT|nr:cupredoxin family copper-binding protein [Methanococcoides methylutens]AKB85188.1 Copper binding protein, plastocyanin/azurin family [Methanococcoides methylutens MM1]
MKALIIPFILLVTLIVAGCAQYDEQPAPESEMTTPEDTDEDMPEEEMKITEEVIDDSADTTSMEHGVLIEDFKFKPATLQISIGDTVTWINMDSAPHTATSNEEGFDSGGLSKDESFSFTFEEAGNYDYICTFHPYMEGEIIVEA